MSEEVLLLLFFSQRNPVTRRHTLSGSVLAQTELLIESGVSVSSFKTHSHDLEIGPTIRRSRRYKEEGKEDKMMAIKCGKSG